VPRKRKSESKSVTSATPLASNTPNATPNRRTGLLSRDEIRRRILLVDPAFARRYRQRDGE